jgi:hypothetical protein
MKRLGEEERGRKGKERQEKRKKKGETTYMDGGSISRLILD